MSKNLFKIDLNLEMMEVVLKEGNYQEELEWDKEEYESVLFNALATAIGIKISSTFQSEKCQKIMFDKIMNQIENIIFKE